MSSARLESLYRELAYYYAFATPEDVKVTMIDVLLQNNITNLDTIFSIVKFCTAICKHPLLLILLRRYGQHNPSGPSILVDIALLEFEDRENSLAQAGDSIPNRPASPTSTPQDNQEDQETQDPRRPRSDRSSPRIHAPPSS